MRRKMAKVSNSREYQVILEFDREIIEGIKTKVEVRYKHIRGLTIRISNGPIETKKIILTINKRINESEANEILDKYSTFLNKCFDVNRCIHLSSLKENQYMLFGKVYEVIIEKCDNCYIDGNTIHASNINQIEEYAYNEITNLYDKTASTYKFPKATLKYRKMKTRWGVCNITKKTITLTKALIHVPLECVYQVICHELTHLHVGNHGPLFHKELQKICPNERELGKKLKEYSEFLYE